MFATSQQNFDPPAIDLGRVEVRPDGLVALVVPALTPAKPLIAAFRQLESQGWVVDMERLFKRVGHEDHIGLSRPFAN